MRYVDALKIWNETENNGKWCFPSKNTIGHSQVLEIMKNGKAEPKTEPKKRIIKIKVKKSKKKQIGGFAEGFRGDFTSQYNWNDPRFAQQLKNYEKQQGNGMMNEKEINLRIRSLYKNTYGQDALNNYDKQQGHGMVLRGNGLILPGRQQRGGGDFPWDAVVEFAQDPMKYVNQAGKFMDSVSATNKMAKQVEKNTGAKRLFKWPWE